MKNEDGATLSAQRGITPIHKPGSLKNCAGPSAAMASITVPLAGVVASGPARRCPSRLRKCVVLNASFSTPQTRNGGRKAQINGARGAHAETNISQPYMGAYHRP